MSETLLTSEECVNAVDMGEFFRVPCDRRDLNYDKFYVEGNTERNPLETFNSDNTNLLTVEQIMDKLLTLEYVRDELAAREAANEHTDYGCEGFYRKKPCYRT